MSKGLRSSAPVLLAFALGLGGWTRSAKGEFRKIPVTSVEPCSLRLAGAQDIPHTCRLYRDANAKLPVWETALGFEFGRLTYPQWQRLVTAYAAWHNRRNLAPYDRDRNYTLMDFMPPMIQAWNRHQFHEQNLATRPEPSQTSQNPSITAKLATNCWGTLYEVLRLAKQDHPSAPTLFVTDSHPMLKALRQQSMKIQPYPQTGDIVLIYHQHGHRTYLDHVALVIDPQLFFEKAGSGDHVPYRLIDRQTLEQIWNPEIYTFEYRRPYSHQQWHPPEQIFGQKGNRFVADGTSSTQHDPSDHRSRNLPDQMTYFAMKQLPTFVKVQGRFHLSPQAYDPWVFVGDKPTSQF